MSAMSFILDPASQSSGTELNIGDGSTYRVTGMDFTSPPLATQYTSGVDSDGDSLYASRYQNRVIQLDLIVTASTAANLKSALNALERKAGKINRDAVQNRTTGVGGTFSFTNADGTVYYFDVCEMVADVKFDLTYEARRLARVAVSLKCLPFWRGAEVSVTASSEATLPVNVQVVTGVTGDVPGLCRVIATDDQGVSQAWALAAFRSRNYNGGLAARLFYQAEALTPLGGSAATAGSGYSGTASGSSVIDVDNLATDWEAVLSTTMLASTLTSVTGSNSSDTFTKTAHGLTNDTIVTLSAKTGGSGLSTSTYYYVVAAATNTFQLATTLNGTAVDLGSDVSSVTVTREPRTQHTGTYRVFARVQADSTNTGIVGVCLEWAVGDFRRPTRNTAQYLTTDRSSSGTPVEDDWILADLGLVNIPAVQTGAQFWEGRVLAKSTVLSDQVFIDHLIIAPADEFYAEATAQAITAAAVAYTVQDDFSSGTYAGGLAGDTLPAGGTWGTTASPYETDDFAVSGGQLQRTAASDTSTDVRYGRIMYPSGTSAMTATAVHVACSNTVSSSYFFSMGLVARVVDKDNFLTAHVYVGPGASYLRVQKVVAGAVSTLASQPILEYGWQGLELVVTPAGEWSVKLANAASDAAAALGNITSALSGSDSSLATGGALASGYCGVVDWNTTASTTARLYDGFAAWVPTLDAAIFASQSLEFRWDGALREDSAGGFYQPVKHLGDNCLIPAAGAEGRSVEVLVKACRNDPRSGVDSSIDGLTVQVKYQPRGLVV